MSAHGTAAARGAEPIAIVGVGPVSILGVGAAAVAASTAPAALAGALPRPGFRAVEDFDVAAHVTLRTQCLDRASGMTLAATALAMQDAGWRVEDGDATRTGMVLGTAHGNGTVLREYLGAVKVSPLRFVHTFINAPAGLTSQVLSLRGVHALLCSGGLAGLQAIRYGCHLLRSGKADRVLCGGVDSFRFRDGGAATPEGPKAPEGPSGEGAGILALRRRGDEGGRVYAEVLGMGAAAERTLTPAVFSSALHRALDSTGLRPEELDAVLLATPQGSRSGDLERAALRDAGVGEDRWLDLARHTGEIGAAHGGLAAIVGSLRLGAGRTARHVVVMGLDRSQCNALLLKGTEHVHA
jgi:3-oxoacyl-[acyl-carrier-protein] synthase II